MTNKKQLLNSDNRRNAPMIFQDFIANNIMAKLSLFFNSVDGIPWCYKKNVDPLWHFVTTL